MRTEYSKQDVHGNAAGTASSALNQHGQSLGGNVGGDKPKPAAKSAPASAPKPELVESSARGKRYTEGVNHSYEQAGLEVPFPEATAGGGAPTSPSPIENKAPAIAPIRTP